MIRSRLIPPAGSFRRKLLIQSVVVGGIGVALTALAIAVYERGAMRDAAVESVTTRSQVVSSSLGSALVFDDPSFAGEVVTALAADREVEVACVYDLDGALFAHYARDGGAVSRCPSGPGQGQRFEDSHLLVTHEIRSPIGERAGTLFVVSDLTPLQERMRRLFLLAAAAALGALALALWGSQRLSGMLIRPVQSLATRAHEIADRNDYSLRVEKLADDELGSLTDAFNAMVEQIEIRDGKLRRLNENLERKVEQRTLDLARSYEELEGLSYSISHDLRAPLRAMVGFSEILAEEHADELSPEARGHLAKVIGSGERMAAMLDDLVRLLRTARGNLHRRDVDVSELAGGIASELRATAPGREAEFSIAPNMKASAEPAFVNIILGNLMGNAWKFTSAREHARIEVGQEIQDGEARWYVRDDGVGFDMRHSDKLFTPFGRLHTRDQFPGTGMGLAIVERAVRSHGGRVWADSVAGEGATFWFTLGREHGSQEVEHA